ncbi:MAG: 50S ribosomal protein L13 [Deltaproteobacteria bacterium]|nr:50S ribosomal protein L13 [Deltaproteobacteria bacterium]
MATIFQSREEALKGRKWHLVDATDVVLGRLASEVAGLIRGKHKPAFTPHVDGGDFVVVINASKVRLSGDKRTSKKYYRHSGYIGNLKTIDAERLLAKFPDRVVRQAVKGMLPKGRLGHQLNTKVKVYAGADHPHQAQMAEPYELKCLKTKKAV